jgi:mono/diheme cytochrome c family protein
MRKYILIFAICFFLHMLTQIAHAHEPWHAPAEAKDKKNPITLGPDAISAGKDIYEDRCQKCHGKTGGGDGPKAEDLDVKPAKFSGKGITDETDGELFWKILNGRKPMPKYEDKLSEEEIWKVIYYIRTLKK